MIASNSISIDVNDINTGHAMEMTEACKVTPKLVISVPDNYYAVLYVNGERNAKIKTCARKKVMKFLGKDALGGELRVLYINRRKLAEMSWGIGNIDLEYGISGGSVLMKVGANGTFLAEMQDAEKFFGLFGERTAPLSITEITSRITAEFRKYAEVVLVKIFRDACVPIFDTDFLLDETDRRLNREICDNEKSSLPGIVFKWIEVSDICVREEDADNLKNGYANAKKAKDRKLLRETRARRDEELRKKNEEKRAEEEYISGLKSAFSANGLAPKGGYREEDE